MLFVALSIADLDTGDYKNLRIRSKQDDRDIREPVYCVTAIIESIWCVVFRAAIMDWRFRMLKDVSTPRQCAFGINAPALELLPIKSPDYNRGIKEGYSNE